MINALFRTFLAKPGVLIIPQDQIVPKFKIEDELNVDQFKTMNISVPQLGPIWTNHDPSGSFKINVEDFLQTWIHWKIVGRVETN